MSTTDPIFSRVNDRLTAEISAAEADAWKASDLSDTAVSALDKARKRLDKALEAKPTAIITEKQEGVINAALRDVRACIRVKTRTHNAALASELKVKVLKDPKTLLARVAQAKALGAEEPLTGQAAAEVVLIQAGKPLHYTEITRIALETGVLKLDGKTPEATVSAYLAKAAKKGDRFVRVSPGVFDLKNRAAVKS